MIATPLQIDAGQASDAICQNELQNEQPYVNLVKLNFCCIIKAFNLHPVFKIHHG
jgi:hypothetical protein